MWFSYKIIHLKANKKYQRGSIYVKLWAEILQVWRRFFIVPHLERIKHLMLLILMVSDCTNPKNLYHNLENVFYRKMLLMCVVKDLRSRKHIKKVLLEEQYYSNLVQFTKNFHLRRRVCHSLVRKLFAKLSSTTLTRSVLKFSLETKLVF